MIRFALIAASTLGFFLTAALGNLMVPLLRAFQGRWDEPKARQAPGQEAPDAEPERPPQAPTMGGLCLMVGVLAAVGVGWTAACVAQPELLGAESMFSVRLLTALLGALLFGGVGLLEDLARIRSRSVLGLRRHTRLGLEAAAGAVVLVLLFKLRPAWLLTGFNSVLGALALFQPFTDFVGGMFSVTGIVYYLSVAGLFLFLTGQALERRRWN